MTTTETPASITFQKCETEPRAHYTPDGKFVRMAPDFVCSAGGCINKAQTMVLVDGVYYGPCVCDNENHAPAVIESALWLASRPWRSELGVVL